VGEPAPEGLGAGDGGHLGALVLPRADGDGVEGNCALLSVGVSLHGAAALDVLAPLTSHNLGGGINCIKN
jgi:hypothetical protein